MGITACCCCSSKDAAITIGIWSLVSSIAQLGIMGWQMAAIKYERDRAANTLLPNYNTYGRFDIPSYFESYWQSPEERYYTGLFVIQVLCLISAFFLVFAAAAMIYGVHTWSKYLVWPWFPCMISSILATLAYCIMWWCGDVRDYWLAITIIEIIVVFINVSFSFCWKVLKKNLQIYCVVVVMMYYRRINATTDEYEGKDRRGVRYKINRNGNSRRDLLDSYEQGVHRSPPMKYKPLAQPYPVYPSYSRAGVPQTPIPLPPTQINTPYPIDPLEVQFQMEPIVKNIRELEEDPVGSWVRDQQSIDRGHEARSEPITVSKQVHPTTLQHSRSVPSLHGGTLVSHRDCEHRDDKHRYNSYLIYFLCSLCFRSSSRRRKSRSRHEYDGYSSASDPSDFTRQHRHRSSSKKRHRSRSRFDESVTNYDSELERERERRRSKRHRHGGSQRSSSRRQRDDRGGGREREKERDRDRERRDRDKERYDRERDNRENERRRRDHRDDRESEVPRRREGDRRSRHPDSHENSGGSQEMTFPLSGGITIPQHIVIPPSSGERGPNGEPVPQKYQINSEITINYDHNGRPVVNPREPQPTIEEPFRRRQPVSFDTFYPAYSEIFR
ncbi:hypothetical protein CRE_04850 [Caenorhabditis remanei]|uniref:Uncharacterized protein n=1 Tax=Caenorhabditis remanei TaxID=31234 RepID=E3LYH0_CAERE|nr:hypothetical protein CRE_04850 [Caenorhabditis remanei]